jgi:hypothetical protein
MIQSEHVLYLNYFIIEDVQSWPGGGGERQEIGGMIIEFII